MTKQNDPAQNEPTTEPTEPQGEPKGPAQNDLEPTDPDEGNDGPDDPHGQPGISKGKYQREMKAKDEEIEKLKSQLDELSKTAEGREKLQKQIDDLKSQLQSDATDYQLKLAGCKNTKAAKALLDDYEGDVAKLKDECPYLFEDGKQTGSTGLPPKGASSGSSLDERLDKILEPHSRPH